MPNFVSEEQINLYKEFVNGIREDLGRNVTLHIPGTKQRCYNCLWDPVNKKSAGIYSPQLPLPAGTSHTEFKGGICPVCNGTGQYTTETTKIVQCLIRWLKVDQKRYVVQGLDAQNDFRLKAPIANITDFENARIVEIDGVPTQVTAIVKRGLRDLIQIVVFCKRSEWSAGRKTDVSSF